MKRSITGRFVKGTSGNPKGRPRGSKNKWQRRKAPSPVVAMVREGPSVDNVRRLAEIMREARPEYHGWRAAAASVLLRWAGGKGNGMPPTLRMPASMKAERELERTERETKAEAAEIMVADLPLWVAAGRCSGCS